MKKLGFNFFGVSVRLTFERTAAVKSAAKSFDAFDSHSGQTNVIRFIRKCIFRETQTEFARTANVSQASVSRWENGCALTISEMKNIRNAALSRGLDWDDSLFFGKVEAEFPVSGKTANSLVSI